MNKNEHTDINPAEILGTEAVTDDRITPNICNAVEGLNQALRQQIELRLQLASVRPNQPTETLEPTPELTADQPPKSKGTSFGDITMPYIEVPKFKFPDVALELHLGGLSIHEQDAWEFPCGDIPFYREDGESDEALVQRVTDYLSEILLKYLPITEGHKKEAAQREAALSHITLEEMFCYTEEDHAEYLKRCSEPAQEQAAEPATQSAE